MASSVCNHQLAETDTSLSKDIYDQLLAAILAFVADHHDPGVAPFKENMAGWGTEWSGGARTYLEAARFLTPALASTTPGTHALAALFEEYRHALKWEQSYRRADNLVGEDMLNGYGFVEVVGKNGPFMSTKVRAGIGVWGPGIDYPVHNHAAEEVYVPLAGSADFTLANGPYETRRAGDAIHVTSNLRHGFRTTDQPFAVFYIWQAGDLREKSTFG
ncbi:MAG: dimethylsulfonioproprionate lyase family protein [Hyphomicrobiaceae bacterium]